MAFTIRATIAVLVCVFLAACDSGNDQVQAPDYTQDIVIDIPAVTLSGDFTLNNGNFPASFYNNGEISLEDTQNLAKTVLGETWEGGYSDFVIISGTYESTYARLDGILVPQNGDAVAALGELIDMDQAHDVNVPRVIVVPTFTLDGNAFPTSAYSSAELFLRPTGSTELISLGTTNLQPSDNVMVVPGVYDVIYSIRQGDQLPQNEYAVIIRSEDISTTPHVLNVDIESATFHGTWRLAVDGVLGEFPSSVYHQGEYSLQNDNGDYVALGPTHMSAGPIPAITGTYDIVYSHIDGDLVPQNDGTVFNRNFVLPPGQTIYEDIIDAWTVVPDFSLDGGAFPGSVYESAEIFLKDRDTDAITSLGRTHNVPANLMIIDGEYDVVYDHVDGETIPQNDGAVLPDSVVVDEADEAANIDVDSVTVQGNFMLDGDSFSQSVYHTADFQLYRNGGGAPILLGKTYTETEPVVILAGNYDVVYEHIDGDLVPQNLHHVMLAGQAYTADTTIDVNALTRSVRPLFTLNGQPFPASPYEHADYYLHGSHPDDYVFLGSSPAQVEETLVIHDNYDAVYRFVQGSIVPRNTEAVVGQVQVD